MENGGECKVCVTGGSGYIASSLIKKLLDKGYSVNATLRSLADKEKVGLLKSLPGAETKLELYEADMYNPHQFQPPIEGCHFVFLVATPFQHVPDSQYKDVVEATVECTKSLVECCIKARSVKRLIYTGSVVAASPLKEDGSGYKNSIDDSCWSPLNISLPYSVDFLKAYLESKTKAEKEVLKYNEWKTKDVNNRMELVSVALGLVGGDTLLPYIPDSMSVLLSARLSKSNEYSYQSLRFLEELLGKVPVVHIEDVCEALVFCMEHPSISGRYLCACSYVQTSEIGEYCRTMYPESRIEHGSAEGPKRDIKWNATKLIAKGFVYKYDLKMTLEDSIKTAKRLAYSPS